MIFIDKVIPSEAMQVLGKNIREQRLSRNWTQKTLAERSGVPLSTLRKFEQKGKISLDAFVRICFCLDLLDEVIKATEIKEEVFTSMAQVLEKRIPKKRQRGRG